MLNMLALIVKIEDLIPVLITTVIFVTLGIIVFALAYVILGLIYPIRKEIEEDHNTALGIVIGAIMIGIAIIIASAING